MCFVQTKATTVVTPTLRTIQHSQRKVSAGVFIETVLIMFTNCYSLMLSFLALNLYIDSQFWKFTFDNHALQDLPAQIAHVQNVTNYDQIAYIGFSQGTLTMFNLLALKPEVSKAIKPYIALAPVAFLGNIPSPIRYLGKLNTAVSSRTAHN